LAERVIARMRDAAAANLADAFRVGSLIELPPEGDAMVVGDLHGNQENFEAVLRVADLARNPKRHLILQELVHDLDVEHNRHCRSWQLVELAAGVKVTNPHRVHVLLGNHEIAELCGLAVAKNGSDLNTRFAEGVRFAYGGRAQEVLEAYRQFWSTMPLAASTRFGVFISHSTPNRTKMEPFSRAWFRKPASWRDLGRRSPAFSLVWGRDYRQETADEFAQRVESEVLLVGHTPCKKGFDAPNTRHIILDSKDAGGAYAMLALARPVTREEILASVGKLAPGRLPR